VLTHPPLLLGAIGIFLYVGGEVSIGSFLINFLGEPEIAGLTPAAAAHYVSYYWGGAMIGRFIGFAVMRYVSPGKALAFNAASTMVLILVAIFGQGQTAMWAILAVGLFNSIMFPTIFSMALYAWAAVPARPPAFCAWRLWAAPWCRSYRACWRMRWDRSVPSWCRRRATPSFCISA
jgi:fucose permease